MNAELEQADRAIGRYLAVGMALVALVVFGIGGWATTAELSSAVIAPGVIVVDSSVKKVQHLTGGVVGELRVRDGDRVRAGDILVRLDETQTRAAASIVTKNVDELLARQARLETERDNLTEISFPSNLLDRARDPSSDAGRAVAAERSLFDLRRQSRDGQKSQLKERSVQLQEEIKGYQGQLEAKAKEVDFVQKELGGVRSLWEKNLVPISRLTALERDAARIEGERSQLTGMIAQARGKIAEIQLQIIQIEQDLRTEVGKDLVETRSKISELSDRKVAAVDQLNRTEIRAPQNGIVHQLSVHTVGGVIAPGEQIMLIVPDADVLAVEVKIAPQDIDHVHVGQPAILRLSAFNQRTTPEITGGVSVVSPDLTQDQRTGTSFYMARIALRPEELEKLGGAKLIPGMPADAFIQTGGRTALSYLIKPLRDQAARALKEP
ncbi:HlyD family type I secretion periplasmic adaptor subunit [Bradyrhizobium genosp. L]|uniref:HlyD family type I secretion periplasmic adaptor subunit n=1 Tax=Bradyrhizobium genosp. L TaxID=83637 RepID=UPI0018A2D9C6|nr:HlyD family type I secretion periplasmic adaptor subunit [Bradyrhizobium genosp. L]QPF86526.1 HlyD family type I secretion periplasmic adaptor subunit [Bradyrhizobium genosp. L]